MTKNCAQSNSNGSLPPKFALKKNLSLKENLKWERAAGVGQSDRIYDQTSVLRADPPNDEELAKKPPLKRKPVLREKPLEGMTKAKVMVGLPLPEEEIKLDEKAAVKQSLERRLSIRSRRLSNVYLSCIPSLEVIGDFLFHQAKYRRVEGTRAVPN